MERSELAPSGRERMIGTDDERKGIAMQDGSEGRNVAEESVDGIAYDSGPSILLFADDAMRRDHIGSAIRAAGGRVSVALGLEHAIERIEQHVAPDGVVIDLPGDDTVLAERLCDVVEQGARSYRFASVALIGSELIDLAAARAGHGAVSLLCEADSNELALALGSLVCRRGILLNDISADAAPPIKLRELSEQVGRIARTLEALSGREDGSRRLLAGDVDGREAFPAIEAPAIRQMIRARRVREQYFGDEIFADPAWDMLLDLTAARLEGQPVAVSSLCIAAAVPPTTALRWIKAMTEMGLFERVADPHDRRRIFIELSPRAMEAMMNCLRAMRRISPAGA